MLIVHRRFLPVFVSRQSTNLNKDFFTAILLLARIFMSWKKPIVKLDLMSPDEFFQMISARCNYLPTDICRDVYFSLIKVVSSEIKRKNGIRLPALGDFFLDRVSERQALNVTTGRVQLLPAKKIIRFRANRNLKEYFNH